VHFAPGRPSVRGSGTHSAAHGVRVYVYVCLRVYVYVCLRVYVYVCVCVYVYVCGCV
jgi:hypothetical protein